MTETVELYSEAIITIKLRRCGRGKRPKVMEARFRKPTISMEMSCEAIELPVDLCRKLRAGLKTMTFKVEGY